MSEKKIDRLVRIKILRMTRKLVSRYRERIRARKRIAKFSGIRFRREVIDLTTRIPDECLLLFLSLWCCGFGLLRFLFAGIKINKKYLIIPKWRVRGSSTYALPPGIAADTKKKKTAARVIRHRVYHTSDDDVRVSVRLVGGGRATCRRGVVNL